MIYYSLKVIEIKAETDDTVTVVFKQPGLKKIKYTAGQYLTLLFRINGRRYIRPYSFSSAPGVDPNLEITVKRVQGGVVSNHIIDKLNVDDTVEVMEPLGDFVLKETDLDKRETHLVLWGAGSGITPLMSLAKYALHNALVSKVTLVYGNRSHESVIFSDKIKALNISYPNFHVWHFHTKLKIASDNPQLIEGRIDASRVLSIMKQEGDLTKTVHYICGPVGLKSSVKEGLLKIGIRDNVFAEDFEAVRNPADFAGIETKSVFVTADNVKTLVEVVKGKSILEACLDAQIDLSYSCQTGSCLVCRAKITQGNVKMIGVNIIPEGLQGDECLLCSAFPVSDNIEIEVV